MRDLSYDHQVTIRSIGKAKKVFDDLVNELRARGNLRFRGRKVSREAAGNAMWFYLADMDIVELEAALAPHVARLEAMLSREPAAQPGATDLDAGGDAAQADEVIPAKRKRGGAG